MFLTAIILATIATLSSAQYYDEQGQYHNDNGQYNHQQQNKPPPSVILNHKQALATDGSFQYSFAADNGLKQGESIAPDGSRKGAYSYVDPNGKTITVTYTADKNGFHVQGDHLPKPVQPIVPHAAAPQPQYQPAPQQQQAFNYQGPATFPPQQPRPQQYYPRPAYSQAQPQYRAYDDGAEDYNDYDATQENNKPHSFGDGYAFQFAG